MTLPISIFGFRRLIQMSVAVKMMLSNFNNLVRYSSAILVVFSSTVIGGENEATRELVRLVGVDELVQ